MRFEWDPGKAASNAKKHGITFEEAAECFQDPLALVVDEPRFADRFILIGISRTRRVIVTVYVERDAALIRIISARKASKIERRLYEEEEGE